MATANPQVVLRMGSHAEKEYLEKTVKFFNGLIIGANLIEATPGATASLLVKSGGKKLGMPFYVDPMTYAYGTYTDDRGKARADLDWIKSDQKTKKGLVRDFKRSYKKIAQEIGGPIAGAVARGSAITPTDLADDAIASAFCKSVADYQMQRLPRVFQEDAEYARYADDLPTPAVVFAPYFHTERTNARTWLALNLRLAGLAVRLGLGVPVHAVVWADADSLDVPEFTESLATELPKTGVNGVWFWFSRFDEHDAPAPRLRAFRALVEAITGAGLRTCNMHGSYFSLALSKYGLSGISHGIGYGEQKDVMPVIGQSTPTVRYYLPDLHKRVGVPQVQRCFNSLGITTPADFHTKICGCVVCKGVVNKSIDDFAAFGDTHYSTPLSKRSAQTPAAAKRCRFHFLLNRVRERDATAVTDIATILANWKSVV